MSRQAKHFYEFGPFRVDPSERRLFREDEVIPLPPKVFDTLLTLVQNSGHLLKKDELLRLVWPDSFVEQNNLTQYVSAIRKALGDDGNGGYVETIPRIGYRFAAGVREVWDEADDVVVENRTRYRIVVKEEEQETTDDEQLTQRSSAISLSPRPNLRQRIALLMLAATALTASYLLIRPLGKTDSKEAVKIPAFKSIAVLPFKPISSVDEHLGVGMADTLIAKLSRIKQLNVRPISSVHKFTALGQDPLAAGRALGVDVVLDGRIQQADGHIRITVEFLSVRDGSVLWSDTFDERSTDIFTLQDTIATRVVNSLPTAISSGERKLLAKRYTMNPEAYEAYLKGRFFWNKHTPESFTIALNHFRHAISLDPNYAQAYAGLADCYSLQSEYSYIDPGDVVPKAKEAAHKALELDESLAEAHTSLAYVLANYEWAWTEAENEYKRALELNPSYATAHQWYGELLHLLRRDDEARAETNLAHELDPLSLIIKALAALMLVDVGEYDQALEELRQTLELDPNFSQASYYIAAVYEKSGQYDKALGEVEKLMERSNGNDGLLAYQAVLYARSGRENEARKALARLKRISKVKYVASYDFARIHAALGENDLALEALRKSVDQRYRFAAYVNSDTNFDSLRSDPRFQDLLRRMNLAPT